MSKYIKYMPISLFLAIVLFISISYKAESHCEIPCGIYEDTLRIELMKEHIVTIEKSMNQINELSKANPVNYNQIVRWVSNKEEHADKFQDIVWQYFMTQRIKPVDGKDKGALAKYQKQIELLHSMLVSAMKCKQTTDIVNTAKLKELVAEFEKIYFYKH